MKLTKKLFVAIMTMALLVVTFGTSTFAWFTLSQTSEISNFKVSIKTASGMEVSLDGSKWTNNLAVNDNSVVFEDLTSENGIDILLMDGNPATAGTNYYEMPIYVRITKHNDTADYQKVVLNSVSGKDKVFASNNDKWLSDVTLSGTYNGKSITENNYYNFDGLNAVKVSFQANTDTTHNFIYGYENGASFGSASKDGLVKVYADVKEFEINSAAESITLPSYVTYKNNTAVDAEGFVKYNVLDDGQNYATVLLADDFGTFATLGLSVANHDDANYLYAKVTIRIWLEGWDADCINAILGQGTELKFTLHAE